MKQVVVLCVLALGAPLGFTAILFADLPAAAAAVQKPTTAADPTPADSPAETKPDADQAAKKKDDAEKPSDQPTDKDKNQAADAAKKEESKKADDAKKEPAKDDDKPAKPEEKRKTYTVKPKHLRIDLALDGVFVADKMTEVPLRPNSWSDYEIVEVAPLGAKVHKGDTLFKFDPEKINQALADLELEQRLNELTIIRTEEDLPRIEKSLNMDSELADRTLHEAQADLTRYNEIDRPMLVKSANFMLKYYGFMLDYEKDELNQLEKMYKADDLTEETEEIVLRRQRNAVEFAEFSLERAKLDTDEMLNVRLPRMDKQIKESLARAELAQARAKMALSIDLTRARYELEQRKQARAQSLEKHAKLLADRALMEIKSPADGIVYYGQCNNGRWADANALATKYQPHNNVSSGAVLMTIVEQRPLTIVASLGEENRPEISDSQAVRIALPVEASDRFAGKVKTISPIPVASGKFEITFDLPQDPLPAWVVAGVDCKVNLATYDKADAIVVPKKAVHDDDADPEKHYVWLMDASDPKAKPQRREVTLGKHKGDEVEIRKGLEKDAVISLDDEKEKDETAQQKG